MTTTCYHLRGGEELEAVNLQNHFGAEAATTTVRSYSPTLSSLDRHFGRPPITFHRDPPYSPTQSTLDRHFGAPAITFHRDPSYSSVSRHGRPCVDSTGKSYGAGILTGCMRVKTKVIFSKIVLETR